MVVVVVVVVVVDAVANWRDRSHESGPGSGL
jgi:hypothetical protein